jgi:hypothetical protein
MVQKGWAQEGAPMHEPANNVIKLVKSWLPNYHRLNKRVRAKIESTGYVTTIMGRKQPVNRDKSYVGLNALIQGSAADIFKQGHPRRRPAQAAGFQPVLFVHDELVSEGPTEARRGLPRRFQARGHARGVRPRPAAGRQRRHRPHQLRGGQVMTDTRPWRTSPAREPAPELALRRHH